MGHDFHSKRFSYQRLFQSWDMLGSTELPKLGGFRVRRPYIPAYPSLQALHTGVSGTPIGTPSGMARWTSHGSRLHVFSRLFTSFRVFALSQEKHLQVGAWVLKLLDRVLMCALILWVPGWTPGLWLQWVSESINLPCACAINLENRTNSYPQIVPQCTTCIQTSSNIRIAIWT